MNNSANIFGILIKSNEIKKNRPYYNWKNIRNIELKNNGMSDYKDRCKKITEEYKKIKKNNFEEWKIKWEKTEISPKNSNKEKTRKNTNYNGIELLISLLITNPDIDYKIPLDKYVSKCDKSKIIFNNKNEFDLYKQDLFTKKKIIEIIENFKKCQTIFCIEQSKIKEVLLSGKTNKHEIINKLNKNLDRKYKKSDLYIVLVNDLIIGLSCKENSKATKSNYSVHKLLGEENEKILKNIKEKYLIDNGFPKYVKKNRPEINKLFYPSIKDNIYWNTLKKMLEDNKINIGQTLDNYLYCIEVLYPVYEFDGEKIYHLNYTSQNKKIIFEEYSSCYFNKNGDLRETAKLFYKLFTRDKTYRVEIRWKGKIHGCSPQFHIHDI